MSNRKRLTLAIKAGLATWRGETVLANATLALAEPVKISPRGVAIGNTVNMSTWWRAS